MEPEHVYLLKNGDREEDVVVFLSVSGAIAASVAYPGRRVQILSKHPPNPVGWAAPNTCSPRSLGTTLDEPHHHVMKYVMSGDYYQGGRLITPAR